MVIGVRGLHGQTAVNLVVLVLQIATGFVIVLCLPLVVFHVLEMQIKLKNVLYTLVKVIQNDKIS